MATKGSRVKVYIDGESADLVSEIRTAEKAIGRFSTSADKQSKRMATAGKTTDTFSKSTSGLGTALKGAALAAGGAAAAYLSIAQIKDAISSTTDLAKTTLGLVNNLDLSTKAASEWAAVAKARGVEGKALAMSFGTLAKNIEAAKDRTSEQAETLRKLGLTQEELRKQGFHEQLLQVADGMKDMGAGTERTAASMKLFGRGWQTVVPLLRDGSKAMQEQLDLANKYGASFSGGSIKSIQELIATERELEIAQLGLKVQFTKIIAPALIDIMRKVLDLAGSFRRSRRDISEWVKGAVHWLKEFWEKAKFMRQIVTLAWEQIVRTFGFAVKQIKAAVKVIVAVLTGDFGEAWDGIKDMFRNGIEFIKDSLGNLVKGAGRIAGAIGNAIADAFSAAWGRVGDIFRTGVNTAVDILNFIIRAINKLPIVDIGEIGHLGGGGSDGVTGVGLGKNPQPVDPVHGKGHSQHYSGGVIETPTAIVGEEAPRHPEVVIATNPAYRGRNLGLWQQAGHMLGVPGFAAGGVIDTVTDAAKVLPLVGGGGLSPGDIMGPIKDKLGGLPGWMRGLGPWLVSRLGKFVRDKIAGPASSVAGAISGGMKGSSTLAIWNLLAEKFGLTPTSGYRTPAHNAAVGGVANSLHTHGSPANPGAIDLVGPMGAMEAALAYAIGHWHPQEAMIHDAGSGLHLHLGFFRKGGVRGTGLHLGKLGQFNTDQLATLAKKHGMPNPGLMAAIAMAESGGNPRAVSSTGDYGLWQINRAAWGNTFNWSKIFDPNYNAEAAAHILNAQGLRAWTTYTSGAYQGFLGGTPIAGSSGHEGGGGGHHGGGGHGGGGRAPGAVAGPTGGGSGARYLPPFAAIGKARPSRALAMVQHSLGMANVSKEDRAVLRDIRTLIATWVRNQERTARDIRQERHALTAVLGRAVSGAIGERVNLGGQTPTAGTFASY